MNLRSKELLSAHLDGALSDAEVLELAELWAVEPQLAADARRYQALGETLRAHAGLTALQPGVCLTARVNACIERDPSMEPAGETVPTAPEVPATVTKLATRRRPARKLMMAVAMAASVAAVAVVGIGGLRLVAENDAQGVGAPLAEAADTPTPSTAAPVVGVVQARATTDSRSGAGAPGHVLRGYYQTHSQVVGSGLVRVVNTSGTVRP